MTRGLARADGIVRASPDVITDPNGSAIKFVDYFDSSPRYPRLIESRKNTVEAR
jgi:hypothetical protein